MVLKSSAKYRCAQHASEAITALRDAGALLAPITISELSGGCLCYPMVRHVRQFQGVYTHYFFYPGQLFKLIKQITRVDFWSTTKSCTCILFLNLSPDKGISNQRGRRISPLSPCRYPYVVAVACMPLVHQENKFPQVFPLDHGTSLAYIFATLGPVP